jgi:hypothetical protein
VRRRINDVSPAGVRNMVAEIIDASVKPLLLAQLARFPRLYTSNGRRSQASFRGFSLCLQSDMSLESNNAPRIDLTFIANQTYHVG